MHGRKSRTIDTKAAQQVAEFAKGFPEPMDAAYFAYAPERLSDQRRDQLERLFASNTNFKTAIEDMREVRSVLAPQYGL
jgi:hypothetical protein